MYILTVCRQDSIYDWPNMWTDQDLKGMTDKPLAHQGIPLLLDLTTTCQDSGLIFSPLFFLLWFSFPVQLFRWSRFAVDFLRVFLILLLYLFTLLSVSFPESGSSCLSAISVTLCFVSVCWNAPLICCLPLLVMIVCLPWLHSYSLLWTIRLLFCNPTLHSFHLRILSEKPFMSTIYSEHSSLSLYM